MVKMRFLITSSVLLITVFTFNTRAGTVTRRQDSEDASDPMYLKPAPLILPGPSIDPAPIVPSSGSIDRAGVVDPAEVVEPAPQIAPAPVILPYSAIREKNRAYPVDKRSETQNVSNPRQAIEEAIAIAHQVSINELKTNPPQPQNNTRDAQQLTSNQSTNSHSNKPLVNNTKTASHVQLQPLGLLDLSVFRNKGSTVNYQILKKNGAKMIPSKVYAPTPFHFVLGRKTTKTISPTTTSPTKTKCKGSTQKPTLPVASRVIPTQTNYIVNVPNSTQPNKAPMQKPITKPTTKVVPQIFAGCSMETERNEASEIQKQSSKVKQTLHIPKVSLPKNTSKYGDKYKTVQTFHIKQKHDNGRARHLKGDINERYKEKRVKMDRSGKKNNRRTRAKRFSTSNKIKTNRKARNSKTRKRRQLLLPYRFANEQQIDPLAQQLLASLPAQPDLTDPQNVLGQMITGQAGQPLLSQSNLLNKQALISPLLPQQGLSTPLSLPQPQPIQPATLPLSSLLPAQNGLSSLPVVSNPVVQSSPVSYQSALTQNFAPVYSQPRTEIGEARQAIPEVSRYYEEYPPTGRRRHHHHPRDSSRRSRMKQYPYEYDSYRSFQDTYGESPGIFDDLKDISSEMDRYIDDEPYHGEHREHRHDYGGRFHHLSHRRPLYKEYKDYDNDERNQDEEREDATEHAQKEYASPEETDYPENNPMDDSPVVSPAVHSPVVDSADESPTANPTVASPFVDPKEEASLHDAEESTENAVKNEKIRKEKSKQKDTIQELKDLKDDSEETQIKRSELIKHLDKDAVMHLDFDEVSQKKNIVSDQSENNNDATLSNGAAVTVKSLGTCGRGIILKKGEISYNGIHFKRKPTKEVSISMWVKSKNPGYIRWFDEDDFPNKSFFTSTKSAVVTKNRWTHLVGTFDTKTGIARIYVNGRLKLEKVGKKNNGLPQDFTSTGIGRKFGDSHVTFLDDVYMFDRVISPEEVTALYKKCEFNRMVLHYGFQHWNGTTHRLTDQSGLQNNATLKGGAQVRASGCDKCGACLDLQSNDAEVYLNSSKYRQKPSSAVSISSWINLNRTNGLHSIFQALKSDNNYDNIYNLEVINGKVHWQSKDKKGDIIFDTLTNEVTIPEGLWSHVTGTYSSKTGNAKVYVNGLLRASFHNPEEPRLSTEWSRASIGGHFPDKKPFGGLLDEFFMYNWELDPSEVRFVSKYCADKPKLVSFTVKVPIL